MPYRYTSGILWVRFQTITIKWILLQSESHRSFCFPVHTTVMFALCCIPRVPNLQDLMPDDLRWSRCNNNRNKVHNKCNVLESSRNCHSTHTHTHTQTHTHTLHPWKSCLPWNRSQMPKRLGTAALNCVIFLDVWSTHQTQYVHNSLSPWTTPHPPPLEFPISIKPVPIHSITKPKELFHFSLSLVPVLSWLPWIYSTS